ncbi:MAG: M13 family metallopeptidase N-terminal domain-containing protein [Bacteroidales bacterium]|nr:M13 family metallopeptidase N-terminal domain-containing protein [Bacteroidales bacterium]
MEKHPIPSDKSRYGSFDVLADSAKEQVKVLIRETANQKNKPGSIAKKIGDFYGSGMDMEARNKAGILPLKKELKRIGDAESPQAVMDVIAQMHRHGLSALFSLYGTADAKNSEMVRAHLFQGGLGLPNRDYYTDNDEQTKTIRKKYLDHVAAIFELYGESESGSSGCSRNDYANGNTLSQSFYDAPGDARSSQPV